MSAETTYPAAPLDPSLTTGLVLCGMGGPDRPEAVRPFLRNLFRDPRIFPVPRLLAAPLGTLIAWRRAPEVRKRYALVSPDSSTPQLVITREQGERLADILSRGGRRAVAAPAMRYWHPYPDEALATLMGEGAKQFLVVPTYPQYSGATNGSTIDFVLEELGRTMPDAPVHVVPDWHLLPGLVETLARPIIRRLTAWADAGVDPASCALLYTAHSLPKKFIDRGDPYLDRTRETVAAVHDLVRKVLGAADNKAWLDGLGQGGGKPLLAFQSKVGPIPWLGPATEKETTRLGASGCRRLMVQPVSFTCEHIETLLELDIELAETAAAAGITEFRRGPALNMSPVWLESMADMLGRTPFTGEVGRIGTA